MARAAFDVERHAVQLGRRAEARFAKMSVWGPSGPRGRNAVHQYYLDNSFALSGHVMYPDLLDDGGVRLHVVRPFRDFEEDDRLIRHAESLTIEFDWRRGLDGGGPLEAVTLMSGQAPPATKAHRPMLVEGLLTGALDPDDPATWSDGAGA